MKINATIKFEFFPFVEKKETPRRDRVSRIYNNNFCARFLVEMQSLGVLIPNYNGLV